MMWGGDFEVLDVVTWGGHTEIIAASRPGAGLSADECVRSVELVITLDTPTTIEVGHVLTIGGMS